LNKPEALSVDSQVRLLADRYSLRAAAYESLWSPVIRPIGERLLRSLPLSGAHTVLDVGAGAGALLPALQTAAPKACVLGIDRSEGMLQLAKQKHAGPLLLMDVQRLGLAADCTDIAVVAFVLFHLPYPERCLTEVNRVLRSGGMVGTVTWGAEYPPPANAIWDAELEIAGARVLELPVTDNRACCDNPDKMTGLLEQAGFVSPKVWTESLEHLWAPQDHFDYQVGSTSLLRLQSLDDAKRHSCLRRVRARLSDIDNEGYIYRGEVVMATAVKP
jgi:ubiquinone/menaquinone biosynthesis C-methylase UbiE